jgi:hypothetical protein
MKVRFLALTIVLASALGLGVPVQAQTNCDFRTPSGQPVVRDHRTGDDKGTPVPGVPVVRDHRACPVVRDHRYACHVQYHTVTDPSRWTDDNLINDWCDAPSNPKVGKSCSCWARIDGKFPATVGGKIVHHVVTPPLY